ncbi:MAG: branched-chain amino acid ABC transporter permease [Candidatus Poribacteria bacterium]|nr:branched-chain amino acid ABC transporter permease [Candidatus Poribacteria bacterium]
MQNKLTPKNIILLLIVCFIPLLLFGIDLLARLLFDNFGIDLPIPGASSILRILALTGLYVLLAVGLNIVCGYTGLLDLGYVGFYLVGGYTVGLLMTRFGFSYWIALPLAVLNGAFWGLLRGVPTLRLTGDYFAIVTFGFAELLYQIVKNEEWLIGNVNGMVNDIPRASIFGIELDQNLYHYYHILILIALVVFVSYRLQHSRVGRAWVAIREDEQAAESMGINISRYKSLAFAVSAAIGALGGAFFTQLQSNLAVEVFEFWESILILCMVVLGGMGNIRGAIIGGIIIGSLGEVLRIVLGFNPQLADARFLIFGIILILLMRYRPDGLVFRKT